MKGLHIKIKIGDMAELKTMAATLERIAKAVGQEDADPELVVALVRAEIHEFVQQLWPDAEAEGP